MEKRLNALLRLALAKEATDIHFTRRRFEIKIEMRIHELMYPVKSEKQDLRLMRYLQYLSGLDVGNLLKPQTGQFEYGIDGNLLSLRYAVISNMHFTSGVLRILNKELKINPYKLSLMAWQNDILLRAVNADSGLLLFSGATGSGKTTTLYSLLKAVTHKKIYTLEDPIEVINEEFVQLPINEAIGFDYAEGIKQVMRHDPDIIMIGEIRDEKAARMAIRAANTGHLVVTSIHATSAGGSINRMVELGADKGQLADVLILLSYQKMVYTKKNNERLVLYELMADEELAHYLKTGKHSDAYVDVTGQLKKLVKSDILDEKILDQRSHLT